MKTIPLFAILLVTAALSYAQPPEDAAEVPETVLTPDILSTKLLGDLEFLDELLSEDIKKIN